MSKQKTFRIVAAHPQIGVPFPGDSDQKLRGQPMTVPMTPYWRRYHGMGIVLDAPRELEVPPAPVPIVGPAMGEE
jgi:hypothetical protein